MALRLTRKRDNFKALIAKAPVAARNLEAKYAQLWASVMRQIMPRDTGAMIESTAAVTGSSGATGVVIGVTYWKLVDRGWVYFEGYHFVEESREFVRKDFVADLKKFVRYVKAA